MGVHANAKLGPAGRRELVRLIREGASERQAAAWLSVAPATAHRWSVREREADPDERASGAWALDRSSRPRRSPRRTSAELEARVCEVRQHTGWGPRLVAGIVGLPHSTCHRVLQRHDCSRRPSAPRETANRYEWDCPGDLLHIDVSTYARFARPGHAVTGDRSTTGADRRAATGYDFVHACVDDHSRLAFAAACDDERAATVVAFVEQALDFYAATASPYGGSSPTTPGPTSKTAPCATCSPPAASSIGRHSPTAHAPTARSNAFTRPWLANGPTA